MRISSLLLACTLLLAATLTIGCNDPYQPVGNPDAAEEQKLKESRRKAEAVRLAAEKQSEAIRQAEREAEANANRKYKPSRAAVGK